MARLNLCRRRKQAGIKPILGTELRVGDKTLLLYVESARGYHNLCRLLSRHAERTARRATKPLSPTSNAAHFDARNWTG